MDGIVNSVTVSAYCHNEKSTSKKNRILSQKKIRILVIVLLLLPLQLFGCGKDRDAPISKKSKTIFIYMCGSNLETNKGAASENIEELLSADIGDDTNIVIETGGAAEWKSYNIKNNVLSRYEVREGKLKLIETGNNSSMGASQTLTDFLVWGRKYYPSEKNILILWDHGSGPVNGVCFDENYSFDPLTLTELKTALADAGDDIRYDIIGFDACLMANLETAVTVSEHADYMIASEEIEPPGGWDYKVLAEAFASGTEDLELGTIICDSYMEKSALSGKDNYATLSVYDLSVMEDMLKWFDKIVDIIDSSLSDREHSAEMIHALNSCDRYGGNNSYQGKSNYIDLLDIFNHAPNIGGNLTDLWDTISRFVPYDVCGDSHSGRGLFFYYPVLYDKSEIEEYINLGIIKDYNSFLSDYYLETPDKTVEFVDTGSVDSDGNFRISLTQDSQSYLGSIEYLFMNRDDSGEQHVLFTDNNISSNSEKTVYENNFDGYIPALEGHRFYFDTTLRDEFSVSYAAPLMVNGERTTFLFDYLLPSEYDEEAKDSYFIPIGLWNGYDENGLPDGEITSLNKGDVVQVVTDLTYENGDAIENWSEEFEIGEKEGKLTREPLDDKEYQYVFVIKDTFANAFTSDMAALELKNSKAAGPGGDKGDFTFNVTDILPYTLGFIPEN